MLEGGLSRWGFNKENVGNNPADILAFAANLESYELHVVKNHAVSIPYYYRMDGINGIIDAKTDKKILLDPRERGGLYESGFKKAMSFAYRCPGQLVFLYSPPGISSFEDLPPEDYAKPYDIGQLYVMWSEGDTVVNLGISVNAEGEKWLHEVLGAEYITQAEALDEKQRITSYITRPVARNWNIDDFINRPWDFTGAVFCSNSVRGTIVYDVEGIMSELKDSLSGRLRSSVDYEALAEQIAQKGLSSEEAFLSVIAHSMHQYGRTSVPLGGGCGGEEISAEELLYGKVPLSAKLAGVSNISSEYRKITQISGESPKKSEQQTLDCICPFCNQHVRAKIENNTIVCPKCDKKAPYYCD